MSPHRFSTFASKWGSRRIW